MYTKVAMSYHCAHFLIHVVAFGCFLHVLQLGPQGNLVKRVLGCCADLVAKRRVATGHCMVHFPYGWRCFGPLSDNACGVELLTSWVLLYNTSCVP